MKKIVVVTYGGFEIFHAGYIHLFKECKEVGDELVVGVYDDNSFKLRKRRPPIIKEVHRMLAVQTNQYVDRVVALKRPSPLRLLKLTKPDLIVRGVSKSCGRIEGAGCARKVIYIPERTDISLDHILRRAQKVLKLD